MTVPLEMAYIPRWHQEALFSNGEQGWPSFQVHAGTRYGGGFKSNYWIQGSSNNDKGIIYKTVSDWALNSGVLTARSRVYGLKAGDLMIVVAFVSYGRSFTDEFPGWNVLATHVAGGYTMRVYYKYAPSDDYQDDFYAGTNASPVEQAWSFFSFTDCDTSVLPEVSFSDGEGGQISPPSRSPSNVGTYFSLVAAVSPDGSSTDLHQPDSYFSEPWERSPCGFLPIQKVITSSSWTGMYRGSVLETSVKKEHLGPSDPSSPDPYGIDHVKSKPWIACNISVPITVGSQVLESNYWEVTDEKYAPPLTDGVSNFSAKCVIDSSGSTPWLQPQMHPDDSPWNNSDIQFGAQFTEEWFLDNVWSWVHPGQKYLQPGDYAYPGGYYEIKKPTLGTAVFDFKVWADQDCTIETYVNAWDDSNAGTKYGASQSWDLLNEEVKQHTVVANQWNTLRHTFTIADDVWPVRARDPDTNLAELGFSNYGDFYTRGCFRLRASGPQGTNVFLDECYGWPHVSNESNMPFVTIGVDEWIKDEQGMYIGAVLWYRVSRGDPRA